MEATSMIVMNTLLTSRRGNLQHLQTQSTVLVRFLHSSLKGKNLFFFFILLLCLGLLFQSFIIFSKLTMYPIGFKTIYCISLQSIQGHFWLYVTLKLLSLTTQLVWTILLICCKSFLLRLCKTFNSFSVEERAPLMGNVLKWIKLNYCITIFFCSQFSKVTFFEKQ